MSEEINIISKRYDIWNVIWKILQKFNLEITIMDRISILDFIESTWGAI